MDMGMHVVAMSHVCLKPARARAGACAHRRRCSNSLNRSRYSNRISGFRDDTHNGMDPDSDLN